MVDCSLKPLKLCCAESTWDSSVGPPQSGSGTLLPAFFTEENATVGGVVYLILLLWSFMGVAIIADTFMAAIEVITSKEKVLLRTDKATGETRKIRVKFWNDTVANLTLMALGSSAPEILLSILEMVGGEMFAGELGPSTVVGSAAFNLFVISAVCVYCIPDGEVRYIQGTKVYMITSSCSIIAYGWLYLVLGVISPDIVDVWEGVLTFLMFPALCCIAYAVDVDLCFKKKHEAHAEVTGLVYGEDGQLDKKTIATLRTKLNKEHPEKNEEDLMKLVMLELEKMRPKTRAEYRIQATRGMVGGHKNAVYGDKAGQVVPTALVAREKAYSGSIIGFEAMQYSVLERGEPDPDSPGDGTGYVTVAITRSSDKYACTVYYKTLDGDGAKDDRTGKPRGIARANEDYLPSEGSVRFEAGEAMKDVKIKIVDDVAFEEDEDFYVELSDPSCEEEALQLGASYRCRVTIIDDDFPGSLQFTKDDFEVTEGREEYATLFVERIQGSRGVVKCKYATVDKTAHGGVDFVQTEGELVFADSETKKEIKIKILDDEAYEKLETFRVELTDASGGAMFTENTDGGAEKAIAEVTIRNNQDTLKKVGAIEEWYLLNREANKIGTANWAEQFTSAIYVNGSKEDQAGASCFDCVLHAFNFPWKIIFALVPPTDFGGGWVCFIVALSFIGGVTAIVGDLAGMLGCSIGLNDDITAITLVALGTSLPDTFASMSAATQDPFADASLGNIMGSNSVNVFLGLGMPWTIGALYWNMTPMDEWDPALKTKWLEKQYRGVTYQDRGYDKLTDGKGAFMNPAGSLSYSVVVFTCLAILCVGILQLRRVKFGGELGGKERGPKIISAVVLASLWVLYLVLSILKSISSS
jgi:solute carrier family 8 (sodium/calcium exchanger)